MQQHKIAPIAGKPSVDTDKTGNSRGQAPRDQRDQNEGEGSRTAARAYNDATERFAKSGRVEEAGQRAKAALEGNEKSDLKRAEAIGKSKSHAEDPAIRQKSARR